MQWRLSFNHFWARLRRLGYCLWKTITRGKFYRPVDAYTYINGEQVLVQITTDDGKVFWER